MACSIASRLALVLPLAFGGWVGIAAAAEPAPPSTATVATAQALFDDARRLFDGGRVHEACEKFAASQKIEPREGTLLNLALCHQKEGKTATAWVEFIAARARARAEGLADRARFADDHIDALAPTLTRLRVVVATEARAPGLAVMLDGEPVSEAAWNTDIPVDPGSHVVGANAAGRIAWRKNVDIHDDGDHRVAVLEIPPLAPAAEPPPPRAPSNGAEGGEGSNAPRIVGFSLLGVGAIGIVVGSVFGVDAIDKSHDARNACTSAGCGATAQALHQDGVQDAWVSDFAIGAGLIAAGIGAYLGFRAVPKRASSPTLRATLTSRGLTLSGSW